MKILKNLEKLTFFKFGQVSDWTDTVGVFIVEIHVFMVLKISLKFFFSEFFSTYINFVQIWHCDDFSFGHGGVAGLVDAEGGGESEKAEH